MRVWMPEFQSAVGEHTKNAVNSGLLSASGLVAGVTLLLALATIALAVSTRRAAKAAERAATASEKSASALARQLQIAEAGFEGSMRPILANVMDDRDGIRTFRFPITDHSEQLASDQSIVKSEGKYTYVSVPFQNVGSGVALISDVRIVNDESGQSRCTCGIVRRDQRVRVLSSIPNGTLAMKAIDQSSDIRVCVTYTDGVGQNSYVTEARVNAHTGMNVVRRIEIRRVEAAAAFVVMDL